MRLTPEKREAFAEHLRAKGTPPEEVTRLCAELERALRQDAVARAARENGEKP